MMINDILCSLPEEYDSKVEHQTDMIDEKKELTLYQVIEALRSKFYLISKRNEKNSNLEGDEAPALYTRARRSQGFKGTCYYCGEYGHKSTECPKKNNLKNNFLKNNPNRNNRNSSGGLAQKRDGARFARPLLLKWTLLFLLFLLCVIRSIR